ncbi:MAG: TonB-dependent receptor [Candidatus Latescibacteria bacterium]|nr:TonB-dependent receptor [Candidatus Latescibacterota bacterium]NIM21012.1 TonB-dependent receptor [Candidatus Latescibacterota bacterium]NIM65147.1 TonB-dependent receptor [Candidatus Latescibacterota bacterium]NIO01662.1 TonB-dependent receptor [Candidatus Latescibacterota bacterium]NIO28179.1 TonB-dependent receptor [Candidatus Latescibacterota bacterium]
MADTAAAIRAAEKAVPPPRMGFVISPFDTGSSEEFRVRHSFSLDHYMETVPGFVLGRMGPIGADVMLSRYGMGAGRGAVLMAGIPINDPQNDIAPLALFPTLTVSSLVFNEGTSNSLVGRVGIEGSVEVVERTPLPDRPFTAFELSKGRFNLRQRRVRFASARSTLGIDLGYDELLNDGYQFDTRELVKGVGYGSSNSRFHTMNLRGRLPNDETFFFSFRWFKSSFQGDLIDPLSENRRSGHFAVASATLRSWRFTIYERGYDVSLPDSHTVNNTTGILATVRGQAGGRIETELGFGFEDILSKQAVGDATCRPKLRVGSVGANATFRAGENLSGRIEFVLAHHHKGNTGVGGRAKLQLALSRDHELSASLGRSFRLPNLGERFLPLHASLAVGTDRIVGNRYLDPEISWEAGASLRSIIGFLENEVRFTGIQMQDEIEFLPRQVGGENWLLPENGGIKRMSFLEERWNARGSFYGTRLCLSGGAVYAIGEREGFFSPVPETRIDAFFSAGRDFFKSSSALQFSAEYQYSGSRRAFPGPDSPPYGIVHLKLDVRLVDAHLYLLWLNVFDKEYRTVGPFLMTPRTLVYGVQWTIFD